MPWDRLPSDRGASTNLNHLTLTAMMYAIVKSRETGLNLAAKSCSFDLFVLNYSHQNGSIPEPTEKTYMATPSRSNDSPG